jgi:nicotinate dehydrogenase subunit A
MAGMPDPGSVPLTVNGVAHDLHADPDRMLLDVLRNDLDLKASHYGCGSGECGACTVLVDGVATPACNTPLWSVAGKSVATAESLGGPDRPHPLQHAFIQEQAAQCGYCTSGMLMAASALLRRCPRPTDDEIRESMARNLCRCGSYFRILRAIRRASADSAP